MLNLDDVLKTLELLELSYQLLEEAEGIGRIVIDIELDDGFEYMSNTKIIYYNKKNGYIIPNYERKVEIAKKIKELKKELAELEQEEKKINEEF